MECLIKHSLLDSIFRVSDSVSLGWDLKIFTSNNLLSGADVIGGGGHALKTTALTNKISIWRVENLMALKGMSPTQKCEIRIVPSYP